VRTAAWGDEVELPPPSAMPKPGQLCAMISSTGIDLPDHRRAAMDACLRSGVFPIAIEQPPARDSTVIQFSMEMVDRVGEKIETWLCEIDNEYGANFVAKSRKVSACGPDRPLLIA
jgi:uncharacterized protein DUF4062